MKKQFNQSCVMFLLAVFLFTISHSNLFSAIFFNWRECLNMSGCSTAQTGDFTLKTYGDSTPKTYIVESAGYFINSHAAYQAFLNRVEISEIRFVDCIEMQNSLYDAIESMEKAKEAYINFKSVTEKIPYDIILMERLIKFDYNSYQSKYGLIAPIFEKVKMLLSKGDISGLDSTMLSNMDSILNQLYDVKALFDKNQSTDISILWKLNQSYVEVQLFGQYASQVFKTILG